MIDVIVYVFNFHVFSADEDYTVQVHGRTYDEALARAYAYLDKVYPNKLGSNFLLLGDMEIGRGKAVEEQEISLDESLGRVWKEEEWERLSSERGTEKKGRCSTMWSIHTIP